MSILEVSRTERDLILKAQRSTNSEELKNLSRSSFSNVRRCVAKNRFTSKDVINTLAYDPVVNVIYVALQNRLCTVNKELPSTLSRCVTCLKDESTYHYECKGCTCINSLF